MPQEVEGLASEKEHDFVAEKAKSKAIPQPKTPLRDHKEPGVGQLAAGFPKLGHLGIKSVLDENEVACGARNLVQVSELKEAPEELDTGSSSSTIASTDAEMMCPSIKCGPVEKAVKCCARDIDEQDVAIVDACLELIKFGKD